MATVKGDVHDIGKNIVGVVLACNNYEVIDLGVMVPAAKILDTADRAEGRHHRPVRTDHAVARRDGVRRARDGAARLHAAAAHRRRDDEPAAHRGEDRARVQRTRRPRARRVARGGRRLEPARRQAQTEFDRGEPRDAGEHAREVRRTQGEAAAHHRAGAREPADVSTGTSTTSPRRAFLGRRYLDDVPLAEIAKFIDWTFFFTAWELKGRFPAILDHPQQGPAARELYDNAQALLKRIIDEKLLTARGVYGFWPANTDGDDIVLYKDDSRRERAGAAADAAAAGGHRRHRPNRSLADFIAPKASASPIISALFAVTAGLGADELAKQFEKDLRRLQRDHGEGARRPSGRGVRGVSARPGAQGLGLRREETALDTRNSSPRSTAASAPPTAIPACPDHSEKFKLFDLLDARKQGIDADRALRDEARRVASAASTSHIRRRSTSTSAGSAATSWRTTRGARVRRWR